MSTVPDPFESFRRARAEEGYRTRSVRDPNPHSRRISAIIDQLAGGQEPLRAPEPTTEASSADIGRVFDRLLEVVENRRDPARQREAAALLGRIVAAVRRFLDGEVTRMPSTGLEFEVDHDDLFEFMLNPDVENLRRAKGLATDRS